MNKLTKIGIFVFFALLFVLVLMITNWHFFDSVLQHSTVLQALIVFPLFLVFFLTFFSIVWGGYKVILKREISLYFSSPFLLGYSILVITIILLFWGILFLLDQRNKSKDRYHDGIFKGPPAIAVGMILIFLGTILSAVFLFAYVGFFLELHQFTQFSQF